MPPMPVADATDAPLSHPTAQNRIATAVAHSGDGWWCLAAIALLLVLGGPAGRSAAMALLVGFLTAALVVKLIKVTIRRERPPGDWGAAQRRRDPHAFPSGHATRTATLAVVAGATSGSLALAGALGLWSLAVSTARVWLGVHHASDVVAGIVIGVGCGLVTILVLLPML